MNSNKPIKFKILSILIVVIYALTFINHFSDFKEGFNEGFDDAEQTSKYNNVTYLQIESAIDDNTLTNLQSEDVNITYKLKQEVQEIRLEYNSISPTYTFIEYFLNILSLLLIVTIILSIFVLLRFLHNMFFGRIATSKQIKRLRFIVYVQMAFAIINTSLILFYNHIHQILISPFNLTLVKEDLDLSVFFIPLILLAILEILKQHLRLKEDADLTI